jgi:myo-inositol 2-dehydrogenase/D-chiro-inositol 1-dehydrogenase
MNPQHTIALFGAGNHGLQAVLPAITRMSDRLRLSAIVEPWAPSAARAQEIAPGATVFAGADELFAAQTPDIVYIATLPKSHTALALRALEAGCHVVCEKPLAPTVDECHTLIVAAQQANRRWW